MIIFASRYKILVYTKNQIMFNLNIYVYKCIYIYKKRVDSRNTDSDPIQTYIYKMHKIEIMTNLPEIDFLDATFDLRKNTYRPYRKPSNTPSHIHM